MNGKKKYIKPSQYIVNYDLAENCADSFSLPGELLTGSVKDKSSQWSAVKKEEMINDDEALKVSSSIWEDEW